MILNVDLTVVRILLCILTSLPRSYLLFGEGLFFVFPPLFLYRLVVSPVYAWGCTVWLLFNVIAPFAYQKKKKKKKIIMGSGLLHTNFGNEGQKKVRR